MDNGIKRIYTCYENGAYSIKQVVQYDNCIKTYIKTEDDRCSEFSLQEEIHYDRDSYCIKHYKRYRNHLITESFSYDVGKPFTPNEQAAHYKGYSAENAYSLLHAIWLLPKIESNRLLLYENKNFYFSAFIFKNIDMGRLDNNTIAYKITSPIVGLAEYESKSELLLSFRSRDFYLIKTG